MTSANQSTSLYFYKNYCLGTERESDIWQQELAIPIFHSSDGASLRIRLEKLSFTMCDQGGQKAIPPYKHEKLTRPLLLCSSLCDQQQYNSLSLPILALLAPLELTAGLLIHPDVGGEGGIPLPLGQQVRVSFYFLNVATMEKVNFYKVLKDVCIHCTVYGAM